MTGPTRMTLPGSAPEDSQVEAWIGRSGFEYWKQITNFVEHTYSGVFVPEWLFGGKKHGWSLRYKRSRSFCTLIPEKNRFAVLIVFGGEERHKVEAIKGQISTETLEEYENATTYHDGKWVLLGVDSERVIRDVMLLLEVKRRPRHV